MHNFKINWLNLIPLSLAMLPQARAAEAVAPEQWLLEQVRIGEAGNKDDLVRQSLYRLELMDPNNPDVIAAQMEGGIGFGLGAILHSAITLKDGKVEQNNFDGYQVLRIAEMPKVEVHIVPSGEAPTGVGEPGVAPIGPALANAIFAATGQRLYNLPFPTSFAKA